MVHFVGAGCGAADLITLRASRLLQEADIVIWAGSLVNPELFELCKPGCELHDSSTMTLEDVMAVCERAHDAGRDVVRLHTGDPSLYGAIHEQMRCLARLGIDYDVVPGVSSMAGAAAALQAELTVPGVSQSVIVTRLAGRTSLPQGEGLARLAAHGTTLVVFLSAGMLERVQAELLAAGRASDEAAAIVYKASWPDEQVHRCTVGTLAATGARHGIERTALVIVGDVLVAAGRRSKLYDPAFTTGYRQGGVPAGVPAGADSIARADEGA